MNTANPRRTDARWPGRRSRPTSTRTGGRTRPVVAVILLILLALIGGYSVVVRVWLPEHLQRPPRF